MMNPTLSQVLLENKNYFPRLKEEFKETISKIKFKKKNIFEYFLKSLLRHGDNFFESYETIAAETGCCSKTVARFLRWMNRQGYIRIQSLHGINQTNNYYIRPKGLKFLMTMRYDFQEYWHLFTEVLMKFGKTAKSLWNSLFLKKCPPINKSKDLNTSLEIGIKKRERSATCCLIGCKEKACTLPKERAAMEIERLREASHGHTPTGGTHGGGHSTRHHSQNHATNDLTTHQRGREVRGPIPGSVDTGLHRAAQPVQDVRDVTSLPDEFLRLEQQNEEYKKNHAKLKKLGILPNDVYSSIKGRIIHDFS